MSYYNMCQLIRYLSCLTLTILVVYQNEGLSVNAGPIAFRNGGYEGMIVSIDDKVPASDCRNLLTTLESTFTGASQFLNLALHGRAHLSSVTLLLPDSWPDNCTTQHVTSSRGETADVTVKLPHPVFGNLMWTQQSQGCGQPGDFIYISYKQLQEPKDLSRVFVQEWAKYRYGVFDEVGYHADPVYPMCYIGDQSRNQVTGCSDLPLEDIGMCDNANSVMNVSSLVHPEAKSSIMFAADGPQVTKFCDSGTHNRYAPTKHNLICNRMSTMEVVLQHPDFLNSIADATPLTNAVPTFLYKRRSLTRYVLVIEDTRDMFVRESWSFLRFAIRKWALLDLPSNTEVGIVSTNETSANRLHRLSPLTINRAKDLIASNIPYTPGDSHAPACLQCGVREAIEMLKDRANTLGPANSVIVIIAPGMDHMVDVNAITTEALNQGVRIATVNYPRILRPRPLDALAKATGGLAYTVQELRYNLASSYLSTYFKLANVMFDIASQFYEGSPDKIPIEIHRRELTDDGRSSMTGSFVLDETLGEPARFTVFTHNTEYPLIRGISLVSPSQINYYKSTDSLLLFKLLTIYTNFNETGTWTYTIHRYPGNPQPHYVQVMATPRSPSVPVVKATAWTSNNVSPLIIYTQVKQGDFPVLGARVEVMVVKVASNGTQLYKDKFELLDTGSGDPDLTKGDGIYTRYFSPMQGGSGLYTFEVTVTDNGNTAYTWQNTVSSNQLVDSGTKCCGSTVPTPAVEPLSPFQRVLPPLPVIFTPEDVAAQPFVGRIGDLKCEILASDLKARLEWTAPDMGGSTVARYELRYAKSVTDIVDRFETEAQVWEYGTPFPLAPGSETTFTLDFTRNPSLLDVPLFVSIRGFADSANNSPGGAISNWIRVLVPSPPPPPPPPSTISTSTYDLSSWPYETVEDDTVIPRIAQSMDFGLELILPIVGGIALLAVCLAVYCYVCVLRRRRGSSEKKPNGKDKHTGNSGKQPVSSPNASITILPSSTSQSSHCNNNPSLSPQHGQNNMSHIQPSLIDEKKRFSVAQLQAEEQMLQHQHEQMLQQQQIRDMSPHIVPHHNGNNVGISTISNGGNNTLVRGRTLSPYQSWTASQLLHEHERRHSPYGIVGDDLMTNVSHAQLPPPVPPLPAFTPQHNGIYSSGPIYGVHPGTFANAGYHRNGSLVPFNPSLQGSLSSVSSGDRKKRNVTMV